MNTALLLQHLREDPGHLQGTDLRFRIPIDQLLLQRVLAARPQDTPLEDLTLLPQTDNKLLLGLSGRVPVIGLIQRQLVLQPGPAVTFPDQPWLRINILSGFRLLDKPLISLLQKQIAERLPAGTAFTGEYLQLHVPALLNRLGYQAFVPLIQQFQLNAHNGKLILTLHLKAS